jgi:protein regulator of cytokinesis 1
LATIKPYLEALQQKKEDRAKQFVEVRRQIAHICGEIAATQATTEFFLSGGDQDLNLRRLEECNAQLQTLQRDRVSEKYHILLVEENLGWFCDQTADSHLMMNLIFHHVCGVGVDFGFLAE